MLNESNSSFDTTPSFDFVMRHEDGRDDEVVVSDVEDEEEGYDLIDGGNNRREDIGVLIVPPTHGSSEDSRNTVLSIPDSVPTVLNSAMIDLPDCVHLVDNVSPTPVRSNSTQGSNREDLHREAVSPEITNDSSAAAKQHAWRRNVLTLLFLAAVSTGSICHAFYLHRESLLLKEQVRQLTDQAARAAVTLDELQQKQARAVVLDNCWLHAHAKMSLGECSQEATENMKETVSTLGSSVHNFWERMKEAYQENVKGSATAFDGFYRSYPANTTATSFGTHMNAMLKQFQKIKNGIVMKEMNKIGSELLDVWNQTKTILKAVNISTPVYTFSGTSNVSHFWDDIKGIYKEKVEGQVYNVGRSLRETPSTIFNGIQRGYTDVKDSIRESLLYMKSDIAESNATDTTETNLSEIYLPNENQMQSISKKVLVAAAWSAGAAILVSTFDMYWNQQGSFPAIEY